MVSLQQLLGFFFIFWGHPTRPTWRRTTSAITKRKNNRHVFFLEPQGLVTEKCRCCARLTPPPFILWREVLYKQYTCAGKLLDFTAFLLECCKRQGHGLCGSQRLGGRATANAVPNASEAGPRQLRFPTPRRRGHGNCGSQRLHMRRSAALLLRPLTQDFLTT